MHEFPRTLFDVYALALPRGHGFANRPLIGARTFAYTGLI